MHYAIVKCEKYQNEWGYAEKSRERLDYWKDKFIEYSMVVINEEYEENSLFLGFDYYADNAKEYKKTWKEMIEEYDYYFHKWSIKNGQCVLWEGKVEHELLRVDDNIYIPTEDKYLQITEVKINPNGEVIYCVEYKKNFSETEESSRLRGIENWFSEEYPELETFNDLKNYKDARNKYRQDYEDTIKHISELREKSEKGYYNIKEKEPYPKYQQSSQDLSWEKVLMYVGIGVVISIAMIFMIVLGS